MKLSVVFTTYNSPVWLQKVLWGFACQTHSDFEIIIADDGSGAETATMIEQMRQQTGMTIRHIWHEDNGFQKCRILNKALLNVRTDYIVLTDGDCIPRKDFLAEHVKNAAPGYYLSGSYYKLPMSTSETINQSDIESGRCFDVKWLHANGLPRSRKTLKIKATPFWANILNKITTTKCNLKGSNASVWLDDVLAVNGFDERMQWGGLDREFGVRLINHGITPRHVRYNAICVHLDHARGYKDPEMVKRNKQLRLTNAKQGVYWTDHGIAQLLEEGYQPETDYALQRRQALGLS
ncbi:MAG: glycosyltransferase family 2 protein [Gammaproteobacteria bacterium]|nr:glycosyltransferase family 2 protein [Gammaproteobacteria bacterium]NVK89235.1 glycosyltransferase family 2 protein [Gammaproteobacteria bacterium]